MNWQAARGGTCDDWMPSLDECAHKCLGNFVNRGEQAPGTTNEKLVSTVWEWATIVHQNESNRFAKVKTDKKPTESTCREREPIGNEAKGRRHEKAA